MSDAACDFGCGPSGDEYVTPGYGIVPACPVHGWICPLLDAQADALRQLRDAWNAHMATCPQHAALPDLPTPVLKFDTYDPFDQAAKDAWLALINERLDAEGLRGKVWGAMHYVCERCGYIEYREMEVGVEGPPHWREDNTFIATAFSAGRHDDCGGLMTHKHFGSDVEYDAPREATARAVFRVPREWPTYPTQGIYDDGTVIIGVADSAFLSLNLAGTHAIVAAQEHLAVNGHLLVPVEIEEGETNA